MKKLILLFAVGLLTVGCYPTRAPYALQGVSLNSFLMKNKSAKLEVSQGNKSVYYVEYIQTGFGGGKRAKYYIFENGVLVKTDENLRETDWRERLDINVKHDDKN